MSCGEWVSTCECVYLCWGSSRVKSEWAPVSVCISAEDLVVWRVSEHLWVCVSLLRIQSCGEWVSTCECVYLCWGSSRVKSEWAPVSVCICWGSSRVESEWAPVSVCISAEDLVVWRVSEHLWVCVSLLRIQSCEEWVSTCECVYLCWGSSRVESEWAPVSVCISAEGSSRVKSEWAPVSVVYLCWGSSRVKTEWALWVCVSLLRIQSCGEWVSTCECVYLCWGSSRVESEWAPVSVCISAEDLVVWRLSEHLWVCVSLLRIQSCGEWVSTCECVYLCWGSSRVESGWAPVSVCISAEDPVVWRVSEHLSVCVSLLRIQSCEEWVSTCECVYLCWGSSRVESEWAPVSVCISAEDPVVWRVGEHLWVCVSHVKTEWAPVSVCISAEDLVLWRVSEHLWVCVSLLRIQSCEEWVSTCECVCISAEDPVVWRVSEHLWVCVSLLRIQSCEEWVSTCECVCISAEDPVVWRVSEHLWVCVSLLRIQSCEEWVSTCECVYLCWGSSLVKSEWAPVSVCISAEDPVVWRVSEHLWVCVSLLRIQSCGEWVRTCECVYLCWGSSRVKSEWAPVSVCISAEDPVVWRVSAHLWVCVSAEDLVLWRVSEHLWVCASLLRIQSCEEWVSTCECVYLCWGSSRVKTEWAPASVCISAEDLVVWRVSEHLWVCVSLLRIQSCEEWVSTCECVYLCWGSSRVKSEWAPVSVCISAEDPVVWRVSEHLWVCVSHVKSEWAPVSVCISAEDLVVWRLSEHLRVCVSLLRI